MTGKPTSAAPGRIRRLRSLIESPADAWLLCRMIPWAVVLPLLKRIVRLETLARLMWTDPETGGDPETMKVIALSRVVTRPAAMSHAVCYERSLLAYRFLSRRGADPKLVVAAKSTAGGVTGHAWITVGGAPVGESETIEEFVPLVVYSRGGLPEDEPARGVSAPS
jgi:hypothetical protein